MSPLRFALFAIAVIGSALTIITLMPTALREPSTTTVIQFRVVILFLSAVALGLTVRLIRLTGAAIRSSRLRTQLPADTLIEVAVWNPALTRRGPIAGASSLLDHFRRVAFTSIGVSADHAGLTFWSGVIRPKVLREIHWAEIELITTLPLPASQRTYPSVGVLLASGTEIIFQVESTHSIRSPSQIWGDLDAVCASFMAKLLHFRGSTPA